MAKFDSEELVGCGCSSLLLLAWIVVGIGVVAFWGLIIYGLYLLVTGQLYINLT